MTHEKTPACPNSKKRTNQKFERTPAKKIKLMNSALFFNPKQEMLAPEQTPSAFPYETLMKGEAVLDNTNHYLITPFNNNGYMTFFSLSLDPKRNFTGWKLHVAIDGKDNNNIQKAWEIICSLMFKYKISAFKIIMNNLPDNKANTGKEICIYSFLNPELNWYAILSELQRLLVKNNVKYSDPPFGDRSLSQYIHYRNDGYKGKYINESKNYNPENTPDPFENFVFETTEEVRPKSPTLA